MKKAGIIFLIILLATTLIPLISIAQNSPPKKDTVSREMVTIFDDSST